MKNNIQYENFRRDLREAELITKSRNEERFLNADLRIVVSRIKKIQDDNPGITLEELQKIAVLEFTDCFSPIFKLSSAYEKYMLNLCYTYLEKHPLKRAELLKKINDRKLTIDSMEYFSANEDKFENYLIRYLLVNSELQKVRTLESYSILSKNQFLSKYIGQGKGKTESELQSLRDKLKNLKMKEKEIEKIINAIKVINGDFKHEEEREKEIKDEQIKNELSDCIIAMYKNLEKMGFIEWFRKKEKQNFARKDFSEFVEIENSFDLTDKEKLLQCSVDSLIVLAAFWMNRYEKALERYANGLFAIIQFGHMEEIMENESPQLNIKDTDSYNLFLKSNLLSTRIRELFVLAQKELNDNRYINSGKYQETDNGFVYSAKNFIPKIKNKYGREYEEYFYDSNLEEDIYQVIALYDFKENAYAHKHKLMRAFISSLLLNPKKINAGIIVEEMSSDGKRARFNNFINVGMDSELNFPVRLHIQKDELGDFLQEFNGSAIIQIYEGNEEFSDVSAQIVTPFSDAQKKILREKLKSIQIGDKRREFFEHLDFLRDSKKVPKHLRDEKGSLKRRYIDLNTGEILIKTKNGYETSNFTGSRKSGGEEFGDK